MTERPGDAVAGVSGAFQRTDFLDLVSLITRKVTKPMDDAAAVDIALSMSPVERKVMLICSVGRSWGYHGIAARIGATYDDVRDAGKRMQALRLATVKPVRMGGQFDGSAIFLNDRGAHVRRAVELLVQRSNG